MTQDSPLRPGLIPLADVRRRWGNLAKNVLLWRDDPRYRPSLMEVGALQRVNGRCYVVDPARLAAWMDSQGIVLRERT